MVGYARTCYDETDKTPLIGFDMGGTSTDVSRFAGELEHVFETTTAGVIISTPQLDINTVAAGGGSILSWRNGLFNVGPESASSHPGPACYRKGGPLTITDANLVLGRINPGKTRTNFRLIPQLMFSHRLLPPHLRTQRRRAAGHLSKPQALR